MKTDSQIRIYRMYTSEEGFAVDAGNHRAAKIYSNVIVKTESPLYSCAAHETFPATKGPRQWFQVSGMLLETETESGAVAIIA